MIEALIGALIYCIVICIIGYILNYIVGRFAPGDVAHIARMVIGAVVIIACLLVLLRVLTGAGGLRL